MKPITACDRCGLRTVRHELEQHGIIMRFCDECYWGEVSKNDTAAAPPQKRAAGPATCGREPE